MAQVIKTYGVVINLDYSHYPRNICRVIWLKIAQNMRQEDFHLDKRMFLITTHQEKEVVCNKARRALNALDDDMDLRLPPFDMGVVLEDQYQANNYTQ